jgi:hypothetical protein
MISVIICDRVKEMDKYVWMGVKRTDNRDQDNPVSEERGNGPGYLARTTRPGKGPWE